MDNDTKMIPGLIVNLLLALLLSPVFVIYGLYEWFWRGRSPYDL